MADKKFDLGDYVEVKDRIAVLLELFPQARITTTYDLTSEPDDRPKVICRALVYRTVDDPIPVTGTSWMYLPGTTSYTKGSEIENAETSAVGRAIGLMGILIDRSIATSNEIAGKQQSAAPPAHVAAPRSEQITGVVSFGTSNQSDGNLRETPDGWALGFNLTTGPKAWVRVLVEDDLALALSGMSGALRPGLGLRVHGMVEKVEDQVKDRVVRYERITAARITADDWELPRPQAPSVALFDEAELDAIAENLP